MRKSNKILALVGLVVGLGVAGWLAFSFFGIQAAFIDNEVSEENPFAFVTTTSEPNPTITTTTIVIGDDLITSTTELGGNVIGTTVQPQPTTTVPASTSTTEEIVETTTLFEVGELASGSFGGINGYEIQGDALLLSDGAARIIRFENFESDNGPDLDVYLRNSNGEIIDLGPLKGNIGDQNYEISNDIDLDDFSEVVIWCTRFSAEFGSASLN